MRGTQVTEDAKGAQVAVITGAAGGIGRATALALARRGMRLCLVDRDAGGVPSLFESVRQISGDGNVLALGLDVTSESDMDAMVARTLEAFGRLDILVTSAGILRPAGRGPTSVVDTTPEEFDTVMTVNLRGTFLATRAALRPMLAARSGHIVHISSVSGMFGRAYDSAYCASKFAVRGFSESLAEEVGRSGIRVHTLMPDAVATSLWEQNGPLPMPPDALPPERVADFIAFLLEMPADCVLWNPVIAPFSGVRRKQRRREPAAEQAAGAKLAPASQQKDLP